MEYRSGLTGSKTNTHVQSALATHLPHGWGALRLQGNCQNPDIITRRGLIYLNPGHHLNTFSFVTNLRIW